MSVASARLAFVPQSLHYGRPINYLSPIRLIDSDLNRLAQHVEIGVFVEPQFVLDLQHEPPVMLHLATPPERGTGESGQAKAICRGFFMADKP